MVEDAVRSRIVWPEMRPTVAFSLFVALALPAAAEGHAERPAFFPDHRLGGVPEYRTSGPSLVVCKRDSARRIRHALRGAQRRRNLRLLGRCRFRHIQAAVDRARSGDRILVLPGVYREEPSRRAPNPDPRCAGELSPLPNAVRPQPTYEYQRRCPNAQNLIAIIGDGPDADRRCDRRCNLQIAGTGSSPTQVVIEGKGFGEEDGAKYTLVRADRADGIVLRNFTVQYADFNDIYVLETNGFRLERLVTRFSREYGVLTFASDNGVYNRVRAYGNGDAGLYPGSGPEGHCRRYGIEIRRSDVHGNTVGISGAAGNGVWMHDNRVHGNALGFFFTSLVPGHPGMPQDCSIWERNRIHSNNLDLFSAKRDGYCDRELRPIAKRDPRRVCPALAVPVGTGILLGGGNFNQIRRNWIYDNWRRGVMQFYAPPGFRGEDITGQSAAPSEYDTSNANAYHHNIMSARPNGKRDLNGVDFWWDGEGRGNCWSSNTGPHRSKPTSVPAVLAGCPRGNAFSPGDPGLQATLLPCAVWHPSTNRDPVGCDWLVTPREPSRRNPVSPVATSYCLCGADDAAARRLAWADPPVLTSRAGAPGDRIVTGRIENRTTRPIELRSGALRVEDPGGRRLPSSIAFLEGFVQSLNPLDRDALIDLPEAERRRLGITMTIAPGQTAPLVVAWRPGEGAAAAQVSTPAGSLPLPRLTPRAPRRP